MGLRAELPVAWGPVQDQLQRFLETERDIVAVVSRISAQPLRTVSPVRRPGARPNPRGVSALAEPSPDILENRLVAVMVGRWAMLLRACASMARDEADRLAGRSSTVPPGAVAASPKFREARQAEVQSIRDRASASSALSARLESALGGLATLRRPAGAIRETPRSGRDPRYAALLQAWWKVRRECILQVPNRMATRRDIRASFLYEQWGVIAIVACLRALGWTIADDRWLEPGFFGTYEMRIRRGVPWLLTDCNGDRLQLWYEPMLHPGKTGKGGSKGVPVLQRAMRSVLELRPTELTFYSARGTFTPDYALCFQSSGGARSLALGDAIYVQVRDDDHPGSEEHECQGRMSELRGKAAKIHEKYSRETFLAVPGEGIVPANDALSFVVFPGPAIALNWFDAVCEDVLPLALRPCVMSDKDILGVQDHDAAMRVVDSLIAGLRESARMPTTAVPG